MPQFDPTYFASQVFWLVVVFFIFYLVMSKIALPRIGEILEERQRRIEDDLDRAQKLKDEAQSVLTAYETALTDARKRAQDVYVETQQAIAKLTAEREASFAETLTQKTQDAEKRIAAARAKALGTAAESALELAKAMSQKIGHLEISEQDAKDAVSSAVKQQ